MLLFFCSIQFLIYLCSPKNLPTGRHAWEFSSAGSEHLPYKQRVGGSNPSTPTESLPLDRKAFFYDRSDLHTFFTFSK